MTSDDLALEPLVVSDAPTAHDIQFLESSIDEFNLSHTGIRDVRFLSIVVRDRDDAIIAGLYGWTWGRCCEVKTLWIHERWRHRRLGTRLISAAEAEARCRGAVQMVLSTHSFQAPEFYRRIGFEEVGRVDDYPAGYQSIYMRKRL